MILCFAKAIGEFGATITFVSNIPGETQTLPSAIYTFTQVPGGDAGALRLTCVSYLDCRLLADAGAGLASGAVMARIIALGRSGFSIIDIDCWPIDIQSIRLGGHFPHRCRFGPADGGLTALFGRSGAGKTSLINVIAGLIRPDQGRVVVDGVTVVDTQHAASSCRSTSGVWATSSRTGACSRTSPCGKTWSTAAGSRRNPSATASSTRWRTCWAYRICSTAGRRSSPGEKSSAPPSAARSSPARACC